MRTGIVKIELNLADQVGLFNGDFDPVKHFNLLPNQYVLFSTREDGLFGKYKVKNGKLVELPYVSFGKGKDKFEPLNVEQECYFDLLNDDSIPVKVATGVAGSGKTKAAIKFGFRKLADPTSPIEKIMIIREPIGIGKSVGFFKGDKNDKVGYWNSPIKDNLADHQESLEELVERGVVEMEIPYTAQGRDIKNCWIIVDEAQNLTTQQFKMLGERVASGSQIVFIGDLSQVVNSKYEKDSGLLRAFSLIGHRLFGAVELVEDVRSEVSKLFATIY